MTATDAHNCSQCGHKRWATDRFCAGCGVALSATGSTVADFVELQPLEQSTTVDKPEVNKALRLGIMFLGLLIAAVVGVSALTGDSGGDAEAADVEAAEVADQAIEDAVGLANAADSAVATPSPEEASPEDEDEPEEAAAAIDDTTNTELPSTFDEVEGYLVVSGFNGAGGTTSLVISLLTGELVTLSEDFRVSGILVTDLGVAASLSDGSNMWVFVGLDGESTPFELASDESLLFMVDDADAGVLIGIGHGGTGNVFGLPDDVDMLQIQTGERRALPFSSDLWLQNLHILVGPAATNSVGIVRNAGGAIFKWEWAAGWTELAPGFMNVSNAELLIASQCGSPSGCERRLLSAVTGEAVALLPPEVEVTWATTISPGGRYIAYVTFTGDGPPKLQVLDIAEGTTTEVPGFNDSAVWVGEHHLVSAGSGDRQFELVDVRTMESKTVDSPRQMFDRSRWIPSLPDGVLE